MLIYFRVIKEMLLYENGPETDNEESEDIVEALSRKLPVFCTRLLEMKSSKTVPPSFLAWDALISSLAEFEPIERVPYCHMLIRRLNEILPPLFDSLPSSPS